MKALAILAAFALVACGAQPSGLHVEQAWASPTPGGVNVSAGYLTIVNDTDAADRLMSASSTRAGHVDVHAMTMDGAVMRMRPSGPISIPAHGRATLAPGGTHLMFVGVAQPFVDGEHISVRLIFERAGAIAVDMPVSRGAPEHHH